MEDVKKQQRKKAGIVRRMTGGIFCGIFLAAAVLAVYMAVRGKEMEAKIEEYRKTVMALYGENTEITDGEYDRDLAVSCHNGVFIGLKEDHVRTYKGIPYAVPPVGDLRWKKPLPAKKDDRVFQAYYFGKSGIQTEAETELASLYPQGEDCLTLNIWTGDEKISGKPVMVFFPGGGYGWGGTADPIYDGQNFVNNHGDVVLVTVNYRIGLMGFIDFSDVPGGEEYAGSGNLGLLDQACALEWVRRNNAGFGGNPDRVTVFGESAGGSSVSLLPLMKEAEGLFQRAIAQSGSIAFTFSRDECRSLTEKLLKKTGARSMQDLLALSEEELMEVNRSLNDYNNFPERDGIILPEDPYEAYRSGKAANIDLLIGSNADEARYWIGEVGGWWIYKMAGSLMYKSTVAGIAGEDRHYVNDFMQMQEGTRISGRTEFLNELLFRVPAAKQAQLHADSGGRTFMYYWTKESAIPHYGACHAVELSYVFGNLDDTIFTGEKADPSLAAAVQDMWVGFASSGDPSTGTYRWEPYDSQLRKTMMLGDGIRLAADPLKEQRELIEPLLSYRINGYYGVYDESVKYAGREILTVLKCMISIQVMVFALYYGGKFLKKKREK